MIFVNLEENKETYTAYEGAPIWKAIYEENCQVTSSQEGECSEETLLYQLMSGLHTSINTHVSNGFEGPNGSFQPNMTYFHQRIGSFPDRIKNLHLIYAAVLKAVGLTESSILDQNFKTGLDEFNEAVTPFLLKDLLRIITGECGELFKER